MNRVISYVIFLVVAMAIYYLLSGGDMSWLQVSIYGVCMTVMVVAINETQRRRQKKS